YCTPEAMTSDTWNVLMLLVDPDYQQQDYGSALMNGVEEKLVAQGDRLLLVETSNLNEFRGARTFYQKCGYQEEAHIQDFYRAGEAKLIFTKALKQS
ncbi:MAG: GNAT family N-acetyltransferase, partial [Limnothrix sp.]